VVLYLSVGIVPPVLVSSERFLSRSSVYRYPHTRWNFRTLELLRTKYKKKKYLYFLLYFLFPEVPKFQFFFVCPPSLKRNFLSTGGTGGTMPFGRDRTTRPGTSGKT
jgi:hypothetical protein